MRNNSLYKSFLFLLMAAALFVAAFFAYKYYKTPPQPYKIDTVFHTDTVYEDTIIYKDRIKPVPKYIDVIKHDTITKDTVLSTEQKYYQETFYLGKDTATVGIVTTGINTEIDSISVLLKTQRTIITNTVEITKYVEKKRGIFHIQPQATFGYDPLNKQWGAVVGIGIGVDI